MFPARTLNHHAALVNRMAETLGVDLTRALAEGRLSGAQWRDAVLACAGCAAPGACLTWLGAAQGARRAQAPQICRNGARLAALRAAGADGSPGPDIAAPQ